MTRPSLPTWASRILGLPGAVSFERFRPIVRDAAALSDEVRRLDDDALLAAARSIPLLTGETRLPREPTARYLALAGEAAERTTGLRPVDEQLLACCALLSGGAVEMDTGEGKTLAGALAAAGHVLAGRRVHVISVNDYLAERDAGWMGPFLELLGASIGWIGQSTPASERARAYRCDVVYAPVSEIGFDVLRDRFAVGPEERVDPVFDVAIVDEADAVMIDEAMVPLVLAGSSDERGDEFGEATAIVEALVPDEDFTVDADQATVTLTDAGLDRVEARLGGLNLYDAENIPSLTRINLALHARALVHRDVDYLVADGRIRLVDASRGRIARLQRWPDGLHAAIEAKERLTASAPGVVLDTVTVQDLLLRYACLSGMSGTVVAVAEELVEFYRLPSGRVERHEPNRRVDEADVILLTGEEKERAIVDEVVARHDHGQPVLVGTQSIAESEELERSLLRAGVAARVLNARNDADEAAIVARAGEHGAVTISTQMSGRGTDIRLGGADERDRGRVVDAGGLAVVSTGRHPSRRLDAQLRGRAGRQGDPGRSRAFAALDDDLVLANATQRMLTVIERRRASLTEAERRRILDGCQDIAEGVRADRHRATWSYTRAIAAQRETVLAHREEVVNGDAAHTRLRGLDPQHVGRLEEARGAALVAETARAVALHHLDEEWVAHLALLQEIRDGIHLRALAGQTPAEEFHRIALREFHGFFDDAYRAATDVLRTLTPADIGRDLAELGLRRPSATWTYMITDNPFSGSGDRFARRAGRFVRSRVLGLE